MISNQRTSVAWHVALWVVQILLAASFFWGAWMKLFQPVDTLAAMWPWAGQIPYSLVQLTGIIDALGGLGLILPALLRIRPQLTPLAAGCIIILMICASFFHIVRGEASVIGANVVFAIIAAFIAWGRTQKAPIVPK